MRFRDLRETKKEIPVYETVVSVRADIALDRAFCLDEVEAKEFVRSRINEVSPNLKVKDITATHKDRRDGASLWEMGVSLAGKIAVEAPVPKPAIKSMVQELVKRVGLENPDVKVHGTTQQSTTDVAEDPDERDFRDMTKRALAERFPQKEKPKGVLPFSFSPSDAQTESDGHQFALTTPVQDQVTDGELEQGTNLFCSSLEFRSKSMAESHFGDKTWTSTEAFEADFPGALKAVEDMAKEAVNSVGEKEVGTVGRHSGIGDSLGSEEAAVTANFDESELDFAEAYSKNNKITVLFSVKTPVDIGEFRISG